MQFDYRSFKLELEEQKGSSVSVARGRGLVASVSAHATMLGINALKDGGNAFDAAFTVAFALAVAHPQAGNIGGGGYLIFKEKSSSCPVCLNYRELSPVGAKLEYYLDGTGKAVPGLTSFGPGAVCVPGTVKAFFKLQQKYGALKTRDILLSLSELAARGCPVTTYQVQCLNRLAPKLSKCPESKRIYVKPVGQFSPGDRIPNPHLSETYRILAREGEEAFYRGKIAEQIEKDLQRNGGFVTVNDLEGYEVKEIEPVCAEVMGKKVWSVPPEGGGAILMEILNILDREDFHRLRPFSSDYYHYLAQAFKIAFTDRLFYQGDTDTNLNRVYQNILDKEYGDRVFSSIDPEKDTKSRDYLQRMYGTEGEALLEAIDQCGENTTHFSVIDSQGNAVSCSYTLNLRYGSKWSVDGAGFLLNGSMDAFCFKPGTPNYFGVIGSNANLFRRCRRPASSMSPVMITDGHRVEMLAGTPGGPAIPTTLAQIIIGFLSLGVSPEMLIEMGRVHHQAFPDVLYREKAKMPPWLAEELSKKGYILQDKNEPIGDVHAVFRTGDGYTGLSDYRRQGASMSV